MDTNTKTRRRRRTIPLSPMPWAGHHQRQNLQPQPQDPAHRQHRPRILLRRNDQHQRRTPRHLPEPPLRHPRPKEKLRPAKHQRKHLLTNQRQRWTATRMGSGVRPRRSHPRRPGHRHRPQPQKNRKVSKNHCQNRHDQPLAKTSRSSIHPRRAPHRGALTPSAALNPLPHRASQPTATPPSASPRPKKQTIPLDHPTAPLR